MAEHHHDQDDGEETYGLALGFRIIEDGGKLFLAEAEIAPYVDEPEELGVTLVFHPLDGIDPVAIGDEVDWPSWPLDIDDDLQRSSGDSMPQQFASIARQLHDLSTDQLRDYMHQAREEAESAN
ncbi:MAG: hypothetical protein WD766_05245 [Gemmatimonadota bacterium]